LTDELCEHCMSIHSLTYMYIGFKANSKCKCVSELPAN
jgi:hypothetical protein